MLNHSADLILRWKEVDLRQIRTRDAKKLETLLRENRNWLQRWEATQPGVTLSGVTKDGIRSLLENARLGVTRPYVVLFQQEIVGQLNVSNIVGGSLSSASIGYWVSQEYAGYGITPIAVALATDQLFLDGLHRVEICIRPENQSSLRVVQKLGFRYEGLRKRFIHINGDWRDHYSFALVAEDVPNGVLRRWIKGRVAPDASGYS